MVHRAIFKPRAKSHQRPIKAKGTNGTSSGSSIAKPAPPLFSIDQARALLDQLSRQPFADLLALLISSHPTPQNVSDFANRNPDKWAQTVSTFAKLTGYREEMEITHNVYAMVRTMSDMDLEKQFRDLQHQIGDSHLVDPAIIETPFTRSGTRLTAAKRITKQGKA